MRVDRPRLQGLVLLVGAGVFLALLSDGGAGLGFHWTPVVLGAVYLVAALLGGPRGSYWATAVTLLAFGLGPVARFTFHANFSVASLYVVALGLTVLAADLLRRRGVAISQVGVGATILAVGVVFAEQTHLDVVEKPGLYTAALAAVGVLRLVLGRRIARRDGGSRS